MTHERLYVASKVKHAAMWRDLRKHGALIISSWIDEAGEGETADYGELAQRCLEEIRLKTDRLILFCEPGDLLKGALIEVGAALACGVPVACVGTNESLSRVFRAHPLWREYRTVEEALCGGDE